MDVENRFPMAIHKEAPIELKDPDGASGAPVFFVYQDRSNQAHLGFAGLVTHANELGRFMVYDAAVIQKIVEQA